MRNASPLPGLIFIILFVAGLGLAYATVGPESYAASVSIAILSFIVASIVASAIKVADQWERVVVLRLGKFRSLEGPACSSSCRSSRPLPTELTSGSSPALSERNRR
jgi:regulator of protease activity HflC (stomatin/prohibitin superfamily)